MKPLLKESQKTQILAILYALQPKTCLEWGSGGSTKYFLEKYSFIEKWVSIEHDKSWYEKVKRKVVDPRLELYHVSANVLPPKRKPKERECLKWRKSGEFDFNIMKDYVNKSTSLNKIFDFIFIDGRARRFCIKAGFSLLNENGVILLHDAQRKKYHDVLYEMGKPFFINSIENKEVSICILKS